MRHHEAKSGFPVRRRAWLTRMFFAVTTSALLLSWNLPNPVQAGHQEAILSSAGDLDPSFGDGGKVITDFSGLSYQDEARSLIMQPDNKIVAAGTAWGGIPTAAAEPTVTANSNFALSRYNSDGSIDYPFGGMQQGRVQVDFAGLYDFAHSSVLLPDGKIIVAGGVNHFLIPTAAAVPSVPTRKSFGLAQLNPNGTVDTSFGTGGKTITALGTESEIHAMVVEPLDITPTGLDYDKIWAAGYSTREKTGKDFAIARYFNGQLLGDLETDFWGMDDEINAIAMKGDFSRRTQSAGMEINAPASLAPSGLRYTKIWAAGYASRLLEAKMKNAFALARYNDDGSLDQSFGTNGRVTTSFDGDSIARAIAIQPDGKAVVAGVLYNPDTPPGGEFKSGLLVRYNPDGSLDTSFGSNGVVVIHFKSGSSEAYAVGLLPDGKIVVAGTAEDPQRPGYDFALACYNSDGSPDKSFDTKGKVWTDFSASTGGVDEACAVIITPDHRVIAGGKMGDRAGHSDFALACYQAVRGFDLSMPDIVLAQRGTTVKVKIDVIPFGGFAEEVTITPPDLGAIGVKVKPSYSKTTTDATTFKLKIREGATVGSHIIEFTGTSSGGNTIVRQVTLVIIG